MEEHDPRMGLIRSLTEFTKAPQPRSVHDAEWHFREQLRWTKDRLRRPHMPAQLLRIAQASAVPDDLEGVISSWRTARFILAMLARENDDPRAPPGLMRELILKAESGFDAKSGLKVKSGWLDTPISVNVRRPAGAKLVEESVPLWDSVSTCTADALGLLLSDYRGLCGKVHACPLVLKDDEQWWLWPDQRVQTENALHFFVDTRFKKGQRMIYCEPAHQARRYRRLKRQAEKAAATADRIRRNSRAAAKHK